MIGTVENDKGCVAPNLLATERCAIDEYKHVKADMKELRDEDVEVFIFKALWDGHADDIKLFDDFGHCVAVQSLRSLSGL